MMTFCTLFDSYYLDKGIALYRSLERQTKDFILFIFCFDDKAYCILQEMQLSNAIVLHHSLIENDMLLELKKERSKAEYNWTCTPVIIEYVLSNYDVENCTYIDADLYFFGNPKVLFDEIKDAKANIVITEHRFANDRKGKKWLRRSGKYCVEFNYFDKSENAYNALKWWKEKCFEWCYAIYEKNRMGDQKYLESFPEKFEGVHELQNLGGGVAPWNLYQYQLEKVNKDQIELMDDKGKKFELIFYHFQNIRYIKENLVNINSCTQNKKMKDVIYIPYLREIEMIRIMLKEQYEITFAVKKSYASNKIKAFFQNNIMQFKVKSRTDIINLKRL